MVVLNNKYSERERFAGLLLSAILLKIVSSKFAVAILRNYSDPSPPPKIVGSTQVTNDGRAKFAPLFSDGSRIYYTASASGGVGVTPSQVPASGGESGSLPEVFTFATLAGISPNSAELLVQSTTGTTGEGPLWVVPTLAGPGHRVGDIISSDAGWSHDSNQIVFVKGNDLNSVNPDGTAVRKIATLSGRPFWIRWSPDMKKMRLSITSDTGTTIWEASADGRGPRPLLPGWKGSSEACCGDWTPDGKFYVFLAAHRGDLSGYHWGDLWVLRERGLASSNPTPTQLTAGPMGFFGPAPSQDGKKLFVIGAQFRGELVRYDIELKQFLPYLSGISVEDVNFSRDAQWVTFVTYPEGTLWRSRVNGSERLQLTFSPLLAYLPRWSPDGKQIAFAARASLPGKPWAMYLVSADGGEPKQLMPGISDVGWSPDGTTLVFHVGEIEPQKRAVRVRNVRTGEESTLPGSQGLYSPRWSPDGRYIAAERAGPENLVLYDTREQKWIKLTDISAGFPSWSADSKYIYFDSFENVPKLYRVRISDKQLEELTSLEKVRRAPGNVFPWSGVTPDGSPLIVRDTGAQEIYALDLQFP